MSHDHSWSVSSTGLMLEGTGLAVDDAETAPSETVERRTDTVAAPRRSRRGFKTRMLMMFALVSAGIVAIGIVGDQAMRSFQSQARQSTQAAMIESELDRLLATLKDAESDLRGYLLTSRREQLIQFISAEQRVVPEIDTLAKLVEDDAAQVGQVRQLRTLVNDRVGQLELTLTTFESSGLIAAQERMRAGVGISHMRQIENVVEQMRKRQDQVVQSHGDRAEVHAMRVRLLDGLAIALCVGTLGVAFWSIRREQMWRALAEIEIKHSHDDLQRSLASARMLTDRMVQMSKLGELLQGCRSITEAATVARAAMPAIIDGCAGAIYLHNTAQNTYESIGTWGESSHNFDPIFAPEDCWAIRRNQVFPPPDGAHGVTCAHAHQGDGGHSICLPMAAQGSVLGVLYLQRATAFGSEQRRIARALAEQLALALANLQLQDTLRTQSIKDPLTGLFNRRYLDASLLREFTRAERRNLSLAVLMIDVDHFKQFNDSHGHEAGDVVLAQIGQVLTQMSRPEDIACRYGGEEMTLVMPEAPTEVAIRRAEEIRLAVARLDLSHRNTSLGPVTISVGVAVYPHHGKTLEQVRQASDRALYAAKHAGRDRVMVAPVATVAPVSTGGVVKSLVAKSS